MSSLPEADAPRPGLRERKKAKTRDSIQREALRLFKEQGYDATTIEQIADAAEISPSTFFRYFPTKEDVVLYDAFDPVMIEAVLSQPPDLPLIEAIRLGITQSFGSMSPEEMAAQMEREQLIRTVPGLLGRMVEGVWDSIRLFGEAAAKRANRPPDDPAIQALTGVIFGIGIMAWMQGGATSPQEYVRRMDEALAHLPEYVQL